jgi:hypothetical protein
MKTAQLVASSRLVVTKGIHFYGTGHVKCDLLGYDLLGYDLLGYDL